MPSKIKIPSKVKTKGRKTCAISSNYGASKHYGAIKHPLYLSSTYEFKTAEDCKNYFMAYLGKQSWDRESRRKESQDPKNKAVRDILVYARYGHPNFTLLEQRLAQLEQAECSLCFNSGMAAITTLIWAYARPGDVIVTTPSLYGSSEYFINYLNQDFNIDQVVLTNLENKQKIEKGLRKAKKKAQLNGGKVALIYTETPSNPLNHLVDIRDLRKLRNKVFSKKERPKIAVDNTLAGPVFTQPVVHGADFSLLSLTKYVGGHSDIIGGCLSGSKNNLKKIRSTRTMLGSHLDPYSSFLFTRSLETLHLRMKQSHKNATRCVHFFADHPLVKKIYHLSMIDRSDPYYAIRDRQMKKGYGSTFSILLKGGEEAAFTFLNELRIAKLAVSLGGNETLACHPLTSTHANISKKLAKRLGIRKSMIRISVGVEDTKDLINDFSNALNKVAKLQTVDQNLDQFDLTFD